MLTTNPDFYSETPENREFLLRQKGENYEEQRYYGILRGYGELERTRNGRLTTVLLDAAHRGLIELTIDRRDRITEVGFIDGLSAYQRLQPEGKSPGRSMGPRLKRQFKPGAVLAKAVESFVWYEMIWWGTLDSGDSRRHYYAIEPPGVLVVTTDGSDEILGYEVLDHQSGVAEMLAISSAP